MLKGIEQTDILNTIGKVGYNNPNVHFGCKPQKYPNDSFNGKSLLLIAGATAGAIIFRKNIAGLFKNLFPDAAIYIGKKYKTISKAINDFCSKHKIANTILQYTKKGKNTVLEYADKFANTIKNFFIPQNK